MLQTHPESRCWLVLLACWCCRKWPPRSSLLNCETRLSRVCYYFCYMMRDERGVKFAANPQGPVIWIRCDSSFKSGMVLCANGAPLISPSLSRCVILQTVLWCDVWTSNYFQGWAIWRCITWDNTNLLYCLYRGVYPFNISECIRPLWAVV